MSVLYRLMYRIGFTPWDDVLPTELSELIDGPNAVAPGRALDMGSGKGAKSIFIARHGWQVTAVENVPRAVAEARQRAAAAGVTIDFRAGDVTSLEDLHLEPGYTLVSSTSVAITASTRLSVTRMGGASTQSRLRARPSSSWASPRPSRRSPAA